MNIDKLRILFESSSTKYEDCKTIGTSYQNMYNIIYKERGLRVDLLEKIAEFYGVPVGYFFDESGMTKEKGEQRDVIRLEGMVEAYERAFVLLGRSKKS